MSIEDTIIITVVGNITADPELTYSDQGIAVARFTVGSSRRMYDKASGSW